MSDEVGSGHVAVEPTFVGFRRKVTNETEASGREGGRAFGSAFKGALAGLGTIIGLDKLKDKFVDSVKGAGDLEQSIGGVQAVFKESAAGVFAYAAQAKTALGLTANEYQELGTIIGSQLKNGGVAMDQLAPKTQELIGLGGDLSAQFGGSTKEAVEALSSAIKGERDPIERYGVSLNQAKIDAEAAALGFAKVGGSFDTQAQQAATLSLIMKQTGDAQGAAARETGSFNSRQATFNAIVKEGKAAIAGAFLPALSNMYGWLNERLPGAFARATTRATVFAESLSSFLAKISAFQAGITSGALTPDLVKALGLDPSSGFGKFIGEAIGGIRAFQASFKAADGDIPSSGFAGFMESFGYQTRLAFDGIKEAVGPAFAELRNGDFSSISAVWEGFLGVARPAGPIIVAVGKAVGGLSTEIGKIISSGLPLIKPLLEGAAGVMQFLAEHTEILAAVIVALAAGMVVWRLAQIAGNIAAMASVPVAAAQAASNFALASAMRAQTAATATNTVATSGGLGARLASTAATIGSTVANVASRVAMIAGAAAMGIATAAQWAWNAALTANPIGLIVLAIVALVAALVWFFTQTELGRQIFSNVFGFIQSVVQGIVDWFTGSFVPGFQAVWTIFMAGVLAVGQFFINTWNNVGAGIAAFVAWAIGLFLQFNPVSLIINNWQAILGFFAGLWANVTGGIGGFVEGAVGFFTGLPSRILESLGNLGSLLLESGRSLIQGFIDGISGMVGAIGDAVGGVLEGAREFFPFSPAKKGPFSGRGYTIYSGKALAGDFAKGISAEQRSVGAAASSLMAAATLTGTVEHPVGTQPGRASGQAAGSTRGIQGAEPPIERLVLDVGGEQVFARIVRKGERKLVRA